eukprot:m.596731 g.596731  ORF g.596731 m.596731 type:complete len:167 (+) comp22415_c0_seq4:1402-1902(+)
MASNCFCSSSSASARACHITPAAPISTTGVPCENCTFLTIRTDGLDTYIVCVMTTRCGGSPRLTTHGMHRLRGPLHTGYSWVSSVVQTHQIWILEWKGTHQQRSRVGANQRIPSSQSTPQDGLVQALQGLVHAALALLVMEAVEHTPQHKSQPPKGLALCNNGTVH